MFFFAAFYAFLKFLRRPGLLNVVSAGFCTGLALLSKFTAPLLIISLIIAFTAYLLTSEFKTSGMRARRYMVGLAVILVLAVIVLNAGYGFDGTFSPLASYEWKSGLFKGLSSSFIGHVPTFLPRLYLDAFDWQFFSAKGQPFMYYLNGRLSSAGMPGYYWEALALKTPLPMLIGAALAAVFAFRRNAQFFERALWIVPAVFMLSFTFFIRVDLGMRYLLPVIPFLAVAASGAAVRAASRSRVALGIVAVLCLWYCSSVFMTFGNGLAYFNELAVGPAGGHRHLIESNLDWGQNLVRLKDYVDKTDSHPLLVYNYGLVPPVAYGIEGAGWVPCEKTRAVVAISVNYLEGVDPFQRRPKECFKWLARMKPKAILGHGLYVFDTR